MKKTIISLLCFLTFSSHLSAQSEAFVQIKNGLFYRNGTPYFFMGTNFWQGMNLGQSNRSLLVRELDNLKKTGITQLRILALSEGPDSEPYRVVPAVQKNPHELNEDLLKGLDYLLVEMNKRGMTAVLCLSNFWHWSGGLAQWVSWTERSSIPYPPPHPGGNWGTFQEYSSRFYTLPKAVKGQQESVRKIVSRINSISKIAYKNDPTIMSWELANEPRGGNYRKEFLAWIKSSAKLIKSIDPNHLVTLGSEGETLSASNAGNNFIEDHAIAEIDYATIHIWVENWGIYNPKFPKSSMPAAIQMMKSYIQDHVAKAKTFQKPVVLEEFGMARDQRSMDPSSTTVDRDRYYQAVFKEVHQYMGQGKISGINFWAWSGEARPKLPYGSLWKEGDPLLGDPAHEEQGWYGVYDSDHTTLELIKNYANEFQKII